jgi:hypothetical protein
VTVMVVMTMHFFNPGLIPRQDGRAATRFVAVVHAKFGSSCIRHIQHVTGSMMKVRTVETSTITLFNAR